MFFLRKTSTIYLQTNEMLTDLMHLEQVNDLKPCPNWFSISTFASNGFEMHIARPKQSNWPNWISDAQRCATFPQNSRNYTYGIVLLACRPKKGLMSWLKKKINKIFIKLCISIGRKFFSNLFNNLSRFWKVWDFGRIFPKK